MNGHARPRFTFVSAVYNVGRYLPDFIASLEAQTHGLDDVEIVMVDDGSTDDSAQVLTDWAARRPDTVRVIRQANAGQGAARNAGIVAARGEWISFPDPDDALSPDYLAVVAAFLDTHPDADLATTHRLMWNEAAATVEDLHPLRSMYTGDSFVDLSKAPDRFHGHSPTSFFRLDRIRHHELRFDTRIRPNFEDGHFNCCYLLETPRPRVGFLGSARYHYRLRADGTSTLQTSAPHPGRYTVVPEFGYLDVVNQAIARYGEVPGWLASYLLYDMHWYFAATDPKAAAGRPDSGDLVERFHELAAEILGRFDVEAAMPFVPATVAALPRLVLAHGYADEPWHEGFVQLGSLDVPQELVRASYFFTGELPEETWWANGSRITPLHAKVRDFRYYGRVLLQERIVWLPADRTLKADLGGTPVALAYERPPGPVKVAPPGQIRWWLNPDSARARAGIPAHLRRRRPVSKKGRLAQLLMHRRPVRKKYAGAWVLMDRLHDAADSGEILFRYLREHHPEINAWFVLEEGGKEWDRFQAAGHGDRLVAHGSLQWRLLMAHAAHLLSSHAEGPVTAPEPILEFTSPGWRFHFLQHGVIKDDLSSWLDPKKLDTFVVSPARSWRPSRATTRRTSSRPARWSSPACPGSTGSATSGSASRPSAATCCWSPRPGATG